LTNVYPNNKKNKNNNNNNKKNNNKVKSKPLELRSRVKSNFKRTATTLISKRARMANHEIFKNLHKCIVTNVGTIWMRHRSGEIL
jgi:hypothetical protein